MRIRCRLPFRFAALPLVAATAASLALPKAGMAQECPIPAGFAHRAQATPGTLLFTLATDSAHYAAGDTVHIMLTVENAGADSVTIPNPALISELAAIGVVSDTCSSIYGVGCEAGTLFLWPQGVLYFGVPIHLAPGACLSYTQTWDGLQGNAGAPPPGEYAVLAGMSTGTSLFLPDGGVRLPITITAADVPALPTSWGALKARYR